MPHKARYQVRGTLFSVRLNGRFEFTYAILQFMRVSVRRLLEGVIDFAGLYPPATLSMEEALGRYLKGLAGPEAWILGRFVCGAGRLDELSNLLDLNLTAPPIEVTVVGSSADGWDNGLEEAVNQMNAFLKSAGERATIEAFETRLPDSGPVERYLMDLNGFRDAEVYLEVPWSRDTTDTLTAIADSEWLGAKARTGGTDVPSPEALAGFLRDCVDLDLRFKLTAGLHEPLSHGASFGFLNCLTATGLALVEDFSRKELADVLADADSAHWRFLHQELSWQGASIPLDDLEETRELFRGFGSCSIDEPLEGLDRLGLLD